MSKAVFQSWSIKLRNAQPDVQPPFSMLARDCKLNVDGDKLTIAEIETMDGFTNRVSTLPVLWVIMYIVQELAEMIASLLTEMLLSGRKPAKRTVFNYNDNSEIWKQRWFHHKNDQFEAIDLGSK